MRITVKIEDIEVTIDRGNFKEQENTTIQALNFEHTVKPTLETATAKAKELHELKYKRFK